MDFVLEYLMTERKERGILLRNWLHGIKYSSKEDCFEYFGKFNFDLLNETNKKELVHMAVYLEYAMYKKFGDFPAWILDKRLVMNPAFLGRGYHEAWLFMGTQACLRHNYFIDVGSMEVM